MKQRYRLKLESLKFCSVVDSPAQPNAKTLLIKRAPAGDEITATAKFLKASDELGLAFFWAFTSTNADGSPHHDLQGDAIDPDFMKAAMDFMIDGGGAVDEMHDGVAGAGRVVFAMPMDPTIASAYGLTTKQSGLMIAIKPAPDVLAKLKDGTYNGVSIAGMGTRETLNKSHGYGPGDRVNVPPAKAHMPEASGPGTVVIVDGNALGIVFDKNPSTVHRWYTLDEVEDLGAIGMKSMTRKNPAGKNISKQTVLTSIVDGHQHSLDVDDPAQSWNSSYQTSYQTMEGAANGHSHAWTFDPATGAVNIGADSGHVHAVSIAVPADVLVAYAALEAAKDAHNLAPASDAVPVPVADEPSSGATVVVIAARAPAAVKSTLPAAIRTVISPAQEPAMPTEQDTKILDLTAKLAKAERLATLTDAQRAHCSRLGADGESYLAKSFAERDAVLAEIEKANEVVYTSKSTGETFRKSDDARLVTMAKRQDAQAEEIAKRDEAIEKSEVRKIAADCLAGVAGDDDTHDFIVKAIRKSGTPEQVVKAITTLKSSKAFTVQAAKAKGAGGTGEPVAGDKASTYAALAKALVPFAREKGIAKVWTDGLDAFAATEAGAALVQDYETAKAESK